MATGGCRMGFTVKLLGRRKMSAGGVKGSRELKAGLLLDSGRKFKAGFFLDSRRGVGHDR